MHCTRRRALRTLASELRLHSTSTRPGLPAPATLTTHASPPRSRRASVAASTTSFRRRAAAPSRPSNRPLCTLDGDGNGKDDNDHDDIDYDANDDIMNEIENFDWGASAAEDDDQELEPMPNMTPEEEQDMEDTLLKARLQSIIPDMASEVLEKHVSPTGMRLVDIDAPQEMYEEHVVSEQVRVDADEQFPPPPLTH